MALDTTSLSAAACDMDSNTPWERLYRALRIPVTYWVSSASISSWSRQRDDIITDIVQEAIIRTLKYSRRAERGEAAPIDSLEHLGVMIAYNCFRDLWRRDRCLLYIIQQRYEATQVRDDQLDIALDNVLQEALFVRLAHEIVKFPDKQRHALLMDLANRMYFGKRPTPLQQAFLEAGIHLQRYQLPLPTGPAERNRYSSLLNLAYKRLAKLAYGQLCSLVA
ncbi:MAG: sigma-70 family RNA polymerase sigma factor [Ktedonobacteraceae bacterium]|nr:sigma-70 family RNA polymerase sigma factor [Ktedonobacteraceae bacterium]